MSFDAEKYRRASLEGWEGAAGGWARWQELIRRFGAPVSDWLLDALELQSGERVLELAAGLGDTGLLAAELVAPAGRVLISDQAESMLDAARESAKERGIANVEFKALNAESIELPVASFDAILCRWGYMLMADPPAALVETRRVLAPGGRLAFAVWDALERNPWASLFGRELAERGLAKDGSEGAPGPFALSSAEHVQALLEQAGFVDVHVQALELTRRHASFEELWESTLDLSPNFHEAVMSRPPQELEEIHASLQRRFARHTVAGGELLIPACTLVASAHA